MANPILTRVVISLLVLDDQDVVVPQALPASLPLYLLPDWIREVEIESSFKTDVVRHLADSEARRALATRPNRAMQVRIATLERAESFRLFTSIFRQADQRAPWPIYSDQMEPTQVSVVESSSTRIFVDRPDLRRVFVGARVLVLRQATNLRVSSSDVAVVEEVKLDSVLVAGTSFSVSVGDFLFPLMDCEVRLTHDLGVDTDGIAAGVLELEELPGASALPSAPPQPPVAFPQFQTIPVFPSSKLQWGGLQAGYLRHGDTGALGRGSTFFVFGSRPRATFDVDSVALDRQEAIDLVHFFESRMGRLLPFWILHPLVFFQATAVDVGFIEVRPPVDGAITDLDDVMKDVGVLLADGTEIIRTVSSVSVGGSGWRIVPTSSFPILALSDIRGVTTAHIVRFSDDSLSEEWVSPEVCQFSFSLVELTREIDAELA